MPITRRIPKRGFRNIFKEQFEIVNVDTLSKLEANTTVTPDFLKEKRLISGTRKVKILGRGDVTIPLILKVHRISEAARKKIENAKGKVEIIS
jgi:large subunit ribosomal protein L15